jgi:hypothetical protein
MLSSEMLWHNISEDGILYGQPDCGLLAIFTTNSIIPTILK